MKRLLIWLGMHGKRHQAREGLKLAALLVAGIGS